VVTFLFTDVEGSTRRWEADADRQVVVAARTQLKPVPLPWRSTPAAPRTVIASTLVAYADEREIPSIARYGYRGTNVKQLTERTRAASVRMRFATDRPILALRGSHSTTTGHNAVP
jgi:hypothetical protein